MVTLTCSPEIARISKNFKAPLRVGEGLGRGSSNSRDLNKTRRRTSDRSYLRQLIAFWGVSGAGLADEETPLAFDTSPAVAADILTVTEF